MADWVKFPTSGLYFWSIQEEEQVQNDNSEAGHVFPCLSYLRLITFSKPVFTVFYSFGGKVVFNFTVQYIFEHYENTHFYVTGFLT